MRKATRNVVGVISLGILASSWSLGEAAQSGLSLSAQAPATTDTPAPAPATSTPETSATATGAPEAAATSQPSEPAAAPTPTKSAETNSAKVTKTSDPIAYVAHRAQGTMQISVTKSGSKITDISILSGGTEGGQWASVPATLADAALKSQGANFGNLGGATHTTDAFYQALESALAKF